MDYREKFKEHYGIDFGPEYHVHHIDRNRSNNDISNLMILPAALHEKYHFCTKALGAGESFTVSFNVKIGESEFLERNYRNLFIAKLPSVMRECEKWYDYKQYLDGNLPNIHDIHLEGCDNAR